MGFIYGLVILPTNRFERDAAKSAVPLKRSVIPVIESNLRQSGIRVTRVSRSAKRYRAKIIRLSAMRLALITYPAGSTGTSTTIVQSFCPPLGVRKNVKADG